MKRAFSTGCLILCLFSLVAVAGAQEQLDFSRLPLINSPSPMPDGYGHIDWNNLYFVNPYWWSGSGPGYKLGTNGADVVFVGSKDCRLYEKTCFATLTDTHGFQLVSAVVAGGYTPTQVKVTAYISGTVIGTAQYFVGTDMRTITFPTSWGIATEVIFQIAGEPGNLVFYSITAYTLGGPPV